MIPRRRLLATTLLAAAARPARSAGWTRRGRIGHSVHYVNPISGAQRDVGPAAAYLPELFATRHRCTGAGSAYALAAVVGGALPPVLAPVVQASLGSMAVGAMLSALGLLGVACGLALPETRHRSLRSATLPVLAEG